LEKLARREEAIRYYTAARSIRPETAHELAHALKHKGEMDEATAVFRDLERLRPKNAVHLICLARSLRIQGRSKEAAAALDAAFAVLNEAILIRPDDYLIHFDLAGRSSGSSGDTIPISDFTSAWSSNAGTTNPVGFGPVLAF